MTYRIGRIFAAAKRSQADDGQGNVMGNQEISMTPNRRKLSLFLVMGIVSVGAVTSIASIRMDGSEFQGASLSAASPISNKLVPGAKRSATPPSRIVATFGQPLMGAGTMTPPTSNGVAYKFGLGYEYNVLKTSYDNQCACPCAADPACDGVLDLVDVVAVVNVAFRNAPEVKSGSCPNADSDVDCSGATNSLDVIKMIDVVFRGASVDSVFCAPCK